jgi:LysM repeat protein
MIVDGYVSSNILYLSNNAENPIVSVSKEIPFRQVVDLKDIRKDSNFDLDLDVENLSYSVVSSRNVEMRANVCVTIKSTEMVEIPVISKVTEIPAELRTDAPSYTVYFSQPGDTLWKIAKRYLVSMDELRSNNNLEDSESVAAGTQMLIMKKFS